MLKFRRIIAMALVISAVSSTGVFAIESKGVDKGNNEVQELSVRGGIPHYPAATAININGSSAYIYQGSTRTHTVNININLGRSNTRKDAVIALQLCLNHYGYSLMVDGIYGSATANAVRGIQAEAGLSRDGVCGPNTWRAISKHW